MDKRVEAIYEAGLFRPLDPVDLSEHERVTLTITSPDDDLDREFVAKARHEVAQMKQPPTLEETQRRLRHVSGSFADLIATERSGG